MLSPAEMAHLEACLDDKLLKFVADSLDELKLSRDECSSPGDSLETSIRIPSPVTNRKLPHVKNIAKLQFGWESDLDSLLSSDVRRSLAPLVKRAREQVACVELGLQPDYALSGDVGGNSDDTNHPISIALPGVHVLMAPPDVVHQLMTVTCCVCSDSLLRTGTNNSVQDDALGAHGGRAYPLEILDVPQLESEMSSIENAFWLVLPPVQKKAWDDTFGPFSPGDLCRETRQRILMHKAAQLPGDAPESSPDANLCSLVPTLQPSTVVSTLVYEAGGGVHKIVHKKDLRLEVEPLTPPPELLGESHSIEMWTSTLDTSALYIQYELVCRHFEQAKSQAYRKKKHRITQRNKASKLAHCVLLAQRDLDERKALRVEPTQPRKNTKVSGKRRRPSTKSPSGTAGVSFVPAFDPNWSALAHARLLEAKANQCAALTQEQLDKDEVADDLMCENAKVALQRVLVHLVRISRTMRCRTPTGLHRLLKNCRAMKSDLMGELQIATATQDEIDTRGRFYAAGSLLQRYEEVTAITIALERTVEAIQSRNCVVLKRRQVEFLQEVAMHAREKEEQNVRAKFERSARARRTQRDELLCAVASEAAVGRLLSLAEEECKTQVDRDALLALDTSPLLERSRLARIALLELDQVAVQARILQDKRTQNSPAGVTHGWLCDIDEQDPPSVQDIEDAHRQIDAAVSSACVSCAASDPVGIHCPRPAPRGPGALALDYSIISHLLQRPTQSRPKSVSSPPQPSTLDMHCSAHSGITSPVMSSMRAHTNSPYMQCSLARGGCGAMNFPWSSPMRSEFGKNYSHSPAFVRKQHGDEFRMLGGFVSLGSVRETLRWMRPVDRHRYQMLNPEDVIKQVIPLPRLAHWIPAAARRLDAGATTPASRVAQMSEISSASADISVALCRASEASGRAILASDLVRHNVFGNPQAGAAFQDLVKILQVHLTTLTRPTAELGMPDSLVVGAKVSPAVHYQRSLKYRAVSVADTLRLSYKALSQVRRTAMSTRGVLIESNLDMHQQRFPPVVFGQGVVFCLVTPFNQEALRQIARQDHGRHVHRRTIQRTIREMRMRGDNPSGLLVPFETSASLRGEAPLSVVRSLMPGTPGEDVPPDVRRHGFGGVRLDIERIVPGLYVTMTLSANCILSITRFPVLRPSGTQAVVMREIPRGVNNGSGYGGPAAGRQPIDGDHDGDTAAGKMADTTGAMLGSAVTSGIHNSTQSTQSSASLIGPSHDTIYSLKKHLV